MSVYRRNSGRYAVLIDLEPTVTGARHRKSIGTYRTRKEAEVAERKALEARDRGIDLSPKTVTVADLLERFVREKNSQWGTKTLERSKEIADHYIVPHLGTRTLAKLRPAHVAEWCAALRERGGREMIGENGATRNRPLSPKTVHHAFALLKAALAWAMKMQLAATNPLAACDTPRVPRREAPAFSPEDIRNLFAAAEGTVMQNLVPFALATGARRGEIAALRWENVNFEKATATIRVSLSDTRAGVEEKATKTERPRLVPLSAMAVEALRRQRVCQAQDRLAMGAAYAD